MRTEMATVSRTLARIARDIAAIKVALLDEGEPTQWAMAEIEKARREPARNYLTLEQAREEILGK